MLGQKWRKKILENFLKENIFFKYIDEGCLYVFKYEWTTQNKIKFFFVVQNKNAENPYRKLKQTQTQNEY